ncbi:MAG: ribonuclease P protein component [Nitrospirae bacterium]|nr:ribonuclease P protein component [Nitrospirota bacterium]
MKKGYEFKKVFSIGKHIVSKSFKVCYLKVNTQDWRLGLAVSKRVGNAVKRNRVKRLLREAFRRELNNYLMMKQALGQPVDEVRVATNGYDVVFVGRQGISDIVFSDLCKEMVFVFGRIAGKQRYR